MNNEGGKMAKGVTEMGSNGAGSFSAVVPGTAVHLVLQGKGGVGKSLVAAILGQYFRGAGQASAMRGHRSGESDFRSIP